MSAATLASAGIAGTTTAADEPEGMAEMRAMLEAIGVELPDQELEQMLSMYQAMDIDPTTMFGGLDPEMLALLSGGEFVFPKVEIEDPAFPGAEDGEAYPQTDVFAKIMAEAMSGEDVDLSALMQSILGSATSGEDVDADAFMKVVFEGGLDENAFPQIEDMAIPKVEDAAFHKVESPLTDVKLELAEAAARGDLDPATLAAILELLEE